MYVQPKFIQVLMTQVYNVLTTSLSVKCFANVGENFFLFFFCNYK